MAEDQDDSFNASKAEVFEALGHPTRIRLLQSLKERPLPFSELKRAAGLDSNGLLTFHLGKMRDLIKLNAEGNYALTDEGREALRIVDASSITNLEHPSPRPSLRLPSQKALLASLLVVLIVLGSIAVYQQQQIGGLNHSLSSQQAGSVLINGTRYWQLSIPFQSLNLPASIQFNGVTFNLTAPVGGAGVFFVSDVVPIATQSSQQGVPYTFHVLPIPTVQVRFADGQTESHSFYNSTVFQSQGVTTISFSLQPTVDLWFTHHSGPKAGAYLDSATDSLELYVSLAA